MLRRDRPRPRARCRCWGLVKHAATWERRWFQVVMGGRELPDGWPAVQTEPRDADLMVDESDTVDHWVGYYREQIDESRAVAASMDLDSPCARQDIIECNVRYVLFHMIEETARHGGHADIIRETLDGIARNLSHTPRPHDAGACPTPGQWSARARVPPSLTR